MEVRTALVMAMIVAPGLPGAAHGQACLGVPFPDIGPASPAGIGVAALGGAGFASHDFDDGVNGVEYGVEARAGVPLGLAASVGGWRRSLDEGPSPTVLRAEASWTLPRLPRLPRFGLDVCPLVGVSGSLVSDAPPVSDTDEDNDFNNVTFPVGLAAGFPFTAGRDLAVVVPYGAFRWLFSRVNGTALGVAVDESDDAPSLELGVGVRLSRLVGVAAYSFAGLDALVGPSAYPDRLFTVRVGLLLF